VGRNYGDRFAGNHDLLTAAFLGNLHGGIADIQQKATSIIERDLSLNGAAGFGGTDRDWFRFDLSSNLHVQITVNPTGGTYVNGSVGFDCTAECTPIGVAGAAGADCTVHASSAGNLRLELHSASGLLASADNNPPGGPETIAMLLSPGVYHVQVRDTGPNPFENQTVQLYDLTIRGGLSPARPRAVAGLSKRVARGTLAFFIADIHSQATEPGATLTRYEWDLDGNGTFEIKNHPRPTRCYPSTGTYAVKLRVTDSNQRTATDTIQVTVF